MTPDLGHADSSTLLGKRESKGWLGRTTRSRVKAPRGDSLRRSINGPTTPPLPRDRGASQVGKPQHDHPDPGHGTPHHLVEAGSAPGGSLSARRLRAAQLQERDHVVKHDDPQDRRPRPQVPARESWRNDSRNELDDAEKEETGPWPLIVDTVSVRLCRFRKRSGACGFVGVRADVADRGVAPASVVAVRPPEHGPVGGGLVRER